MASLEKWRRTYPFQYAKMISKVVDDYKIHIHQLQEQLMAQGWIVWQQAGPHRVQYNGSYHRFESLKLAYYLEHPDLRWSSVWLSGDQWGIMYQDTMAYCNNNERNGYKGLNINGLNFKARCGTLEAYYETALKLTTNLY